MRKISTVMYQPKKAQLTVEQVENSNGGSPVWSYFWLCNHQGGLEPPQHPFLFLPSVTVMSNSSAEVGRPNVPILPLRDQRDGEGLHWALREGRHSRCQGHRQRGRQRWGRPRGHRADGQRNGGTEEGAWTDWEMSWGVTGRGQTLGSDAPTLVDN